MKLETTYDIFEVARDALEGLRGGRYTVSEVQAMSSVLSNMNRIAATSLRHAEMTGRLVRGGENLPAMRIMPEQEIAEAAE